MNNGKHLLAEFYQCQCANSLLCNTQPLLDQLIDAVQAVGLTLVGQAVHEFVNTHPSIEEEDDKAHTNSYIQQTSGVTFSLLLAESHICIHTWGELQTVTLDIYVCNFLQDNSTKADALLAFCKQLFQPTSDDVRTIWRNHG